jgi:hypothetical protein
MKIRTLAVLLALVAGTVGVTLYFVGANRTTAAARVAAADPIYAQLSSMTTQLPKDGPLMVQMENNDALGGLEHSDKTKTGDIVIKTPGVYFMVAAIQVAKEKGETDEYVDVWIKQNDKDVDNSGCRQQIKDTKFTTVLVSQGVAECKAGDKFNVMISSSSADKGLGIYATKPKGEATIPSIIFSVYKIN